jgi:predicted RNase H-like nuclease (RuvC/YqgF family)
MKSTNGWWGNHMDWSTLIAALISALLGGGGVAAWFEARIKKTAVEAESVNRRREIDIDAWCKLIDTQGARIDKLIARVGALEKELEIRDIRIDELEDEVDSLRTLMREKGITPPPRKRQLRKSDTHLTNG